MFEKLSKDCLIQIKVSKEQKEEIKKMAESNKKNISEFILTLIQEYYDINNK